MTWKIFNPEPSSSLTFEWVVRQLRKIGETNNNQITRYEDLRFPVANLTVGASAPVENATYGWFEFQGNRPTGIICSARYSFPMHGVKVQPCIRMSTG